MAERSLKAGRPAQTVLLPDADHYFTRTPDRVQLLSAIESFLAVNLK